MKHIVLLCDGMADRAVPGLGGLTPMQASRKPVMDGLFADSSFGLARTVPQGMSPGSDVANLSAFGYDPTVCYTGRSPLEAVSMGLVLRDDDTALRCNFVTLSAEADYAACTMTDYSAGEIGTDEAGELMTAVAAELNRPGLSFHPGISYRHCLLWNRGPLDIRLTPPHDISGRVVGDWLPKGPGAELALELMERSRAVLKDHPVNLRRIAEGKNPATSIWLWGQGTKPALDSFMNSYGKSGAVISAVDLIKGIGIAAGMDIIDVPGATGNIHTNFRGKGEAALKALRDGHDFVYIHVEAPDECGHQGLVQEKVLSIEKIDAEVLTPLLDGLDGREDYRILILPDHPTPLDIRTHTTDPVPWLIYDSRSGNRRKTAAAGRSFTEATAADGEMVPEAWHLMRRLLEQPEVR